MVTPPDKYCYDYPRPAVTVDAAVFCRPAAHWQVLLIRRRHAPFKDFWAFPGGFVDEHETLEQAVCRETSEETGLTDLKFSQFRAYSKPDRDPRHRTITIVFVAFTADESGLHAGDDASAVRWFSLNDLPPLAFDHGVILHDLVNEFNLRD
ncbi:MAG TPA: NUDIX hydrolase [Bacteroidales bacterium]|nr:NUDIX hydrolase [Bacteroidales bacterium]